MYDTWGSFTLLCEKYLIICNKYRNIPKLVRPYTIFKKQMYYFFVLNHGQYIPRGPDATIKWLHEKVHGSVTVSVSVALCRG